MNACNQDVVSEPTRRMKREMKRKTRTRHSFSTGKISKKIAVEESVSQSVTN